MNKNLCVFIYVSPAIVRPTELGGSYIYAAASLLSFLMLATTQSHMHTHSDVHTSRYECVMYFKNNDINSQTFLYCKAIQNVLFDTVSYGLANS